jgi:hypothetical protein
MNVEARTPIEGVVDALGKQVHEGDIIAYGMLTSRARIYVGKVVGKSASKIQVAPGVYSPNAAGSPYKTLVFSERITSLDSKANRLIVITDLINVPVQQPDGVVLIQ